MEIILSRESVQALYTYLTEGIASKKDMGLIREEVLKELKKLLESEKCL